MKKILSIVVLIALALSIAGVGAAESGESTAQVPAELEAMYDAFIAAADEQYAYDIAYELTTNPEYMTSELGGRNAGSDAEHAAAEYLEGVMTEIGLADVQREAAQCDLWSMDGASLTVGEDSYQVYSYASAATPAEGLTAEVVYVGDGTMWGLRGHRC